MEVFQRPEPYEDSRLNLSTEVTMSSVVRSPLALVFVYLVRLLLFTSKAWSAQCQRLEINSEVDSMRCVSSKPGLCSN